MDAFSMPRESVLAVAESFSNLAFGSSFWHGSHTNLGNTVDVVPIAIIAYVAYQAMVENLRARIHRSD
jgi:hypothetical protein